MKIILDTDNITSAARFVTAVSNPGCKGVTWRDSSHSAHDYTPVRSVRVELSPAEEKAVGSALRNVTRSAAFSSDGRFSAGELREELAAYARERRDAGRADNTVDLDSARSSTSFTGSIPGSCLAAISVASKEPATSMVTGSSLP